MKRQVFSIVVLSGLLLTPFVGMAADKQKVCHDGYRGAYETVYSAPEESFIIEKKCPEGLRVELQVYKAPVAVNNSSEVKSSTPEQMVALKKISIPSVLFKFDSDEILPEGKKALDDFATQVAKKDSIEVAGYTCWIGTQTYNQTISIRRAEAVADYLRTKGLSVKKVEGKGEHELLDRTNASKNRRVEINLDNQKEVSGTEVSK